MKAKTRAAVLIFQIVTGLVTASAQASGGQTYRVGPISSALGTSGRAAVDPTEAGWLNPAALVHAQSSHFAISHQQSHPERGYSYRDFAVMLADGGEDKLAAGSFSYIQRDIPGSLSAASGEQKDFQFSLAGFIPGRKSSLGITFRRLLHQQPGFDLTQDTFSVGFLMPVTEKFGLALVGQDLAGAGDSVAPEARLIPTYALAFHAIPHSIAHVRGDAVRPIENNPDGRNNVHLGLESWFREDFAFRLGGSWLETLDQTWVSVGLGFKGPRLSFGYAFESLIVTETRSGNGTRHTFDLWLPL